MGRTKLRWQEPPHTVAELPGEMWNKALPASDPIARGVVMTFEGDGYETYIAGVGSASGVSAPNRKAKPKAQIGFRLPPPPVPEPPKPRRRSTRRTS